MHPTETSYCRSPRSIVTLCSMNLNGLSGSERIVMTRLESPGIPVQRSPACRYGGHPDADAQVVTRQLHAAGGRAASPRGLPTTGFPCSTVTRHPRCAPPTALSTPMLRSGCGPQRRTHSNRHPRSTERSGSFVILVRWTTRASATTASSSTDGSQGFLRGSIDRYRPIGQASSFRLVPRSVCLDRRPPPGVEMPA